VGGISSLTLPTNPTPAFPLNVFSILDFSFHDSGRVISGNVFIGSFDTGPISIPGAGIHGGRFKAHSLCLGLPGADRASA
jgi:hypothetical protein